MRDIIGSLHRLESARGGKAYLIELDDRSILIDTGLPSSAGAVVAELAGAGILPLTDIALTHYDADHIGAAAAVQKATGARVWLGAADVAILHHDEAPPTRVRRWMLNSGFLGRADLPELTELPDARARLLGAIHVGPPPVTVACAGIVAVAARIRAYSPRFQLSQSQP